MSQMLWAKALSGRPGCIPKGRPRGAKAAGVRYENSFARMLPQALHGQWFQYQLAGEAPRFCQTDLLLQHGGTLYVLECKYTWTLDAYQQLEGLYLPVLRAAQPRPVRGIVVCKTLKPEAKGASFIAGSLGELLCLPPGRLPVLHWLGQPLGPLHGASRPDTLALGRSPA